MECTFYSFLSQYITHYYRALYTQYMIHNDVYMIHSDVCMIHSDVCMIHSDVCMINSDVCMIDYHAL